MGRFCVGEMKSNNAVNIISSNKNIQEGKRKCSLTGSCGEIELNYVIKLKRPTQLTKYGQN